MALTYRQVKDIYDNLADAGVVTSSLPEWSAEQNALLGTDAYAAGQQDNWVKRTSVGIDRLLEATGLPDLLGDVGESVGGWVGNPEAGRSIGHGALRGAVNFLPAFAGGPLGLGAAAGLAGSDAYTQTGSPGAGVFSGLLTAAMPGIGQLAERGVLRALGAPVIEGQVLTKAAEAAALAGEALPANAYQAVKTVLPQNLWQGAAGQIGANVGAFGAGELARAAKAGLTPDDPMNPESEYEFSPSEALLNLTLGQVPFAALYATKGGKAALGGKTTREYEASLNAGIAQAKVVQERSRLLEEANKKSPIESIPVINPEYNPTQLANYNRQIEEIRKAQKTALEESTPESLAEAKRLQEEEDAMRGTSVPYDLDGVAGVKLSEESPRTVIPGVIHFENKQTGYRIIKTPDGKLIGYSTKFEPEAVASEQFPGFTDFSVPDNHSSPVIDNKAELRAQKAALAAAQNPELPIQPENPLDYFDHVSALAEAEAQLTAAKTPVELQEALVKANGVRQAAGFGPVTDRVIEKRMELMKLNYQKAALAEVRKTKRMMDAVEAEQDNLAKAAARVQGVSDAVTSGTQKGTEGASKPVVKLPSLDRDTAAIYDWLDEVMSAKTLNRDAEEAYNAWDVEAKPPLPVEKERFKIYYKLRALGDLSAGEKLTPAEAEYFNEELRSEGIGVDNVKELLDFPERDHVLNWTDAVDDKLNQPRQAPAPIVENKIPAGGGFVWAVSRMFKGDKLGKGFTLGQDGIVSAKTFEKAEAMESIPGIERELYRQVVPEAFVGDKVNVRLLQEELGKRVVTEVKKLEGSGLNTDTATVERLQHELETVWPSYRNARSQLEVAGHDVADASFIELWAKMAPNEEAAKLLRDYVSVAIRNIFGAPEGEARYDFIAPKSESNMPGYVEGLVRVPKADKATERQNLLRGTTNPDGIKYTGPHFGSEDTNVLAFFRGYEEKLPDGRKAFHVIEVQSDWGQARRKAEDRMREIRSPDDEAYPNQRAVIDKESPNHPLLPAYETLALKAAIAHAKEIGAEAVILSDAETAMMSEGHDKHATQTWTSKSFDDSQIPASKQVNEKEAELKAKGIDFKTDYKNGKYTITWTDIAQSNGMRLHYDKTLPSALEKLTGEKGERVELGTHERGLGPQGDQTFVEQQEFTNREDAAKYAREKNVGHQTADVQMISEGKWRVTVGARKVIGSPVFRNPDGTPKSSITGLSFSLNKIPDSPKFTLSEKSNAPYVPKTEGEQIVATALRLNEGAAGGLKHILESVPLNSWQSVLARDLMKGFPELLSRMKARLVDGEGPSSAWVDPISRLGGITYKSDVLSALPADRATLVLHEVVHQLTLAELENPTKVENVTQLSDLRERIKSSLSAEMKRALANAEGNGFLERWGRGEAEFSELHSDPNKAQILYGLLNNKEFVTQGFTSKAFRDLLLSSAGKKQGWWSKFTSFVRSIVGLRPEVLPGTAMEEFLGVSSALLNQGEYVATFQNFAERYLENRGLPTMDALNASRKALAIVLHSSFEKVSPEQIHEFTLANTQVSPRDLVALINEKGEDFNHFAQSMGELGYEATKTGTDKLLTDALAGDVPVEALAVLPDRAALYLFSKLHAMRDIADVVRAATETSNKGLVNIAKPANLWEGASAAVKQIDSLLEVESQFKEGLAIVEAIQGIEPANFYTKVVTQPRFFEEGNSFAPLFFKDKLKEGKESVGGFLQALNKFLRPTRQYDDPILTEGFSFGYQLTANARKMKTDAYKAFSMDMEESARQGKTVYTEKSVQESAKDLTQPKLLNAVNKWIYANQAVAKKEGRGVTMLPVEHPEVAKVVAGLNPAEKKKVAEYMAKRGMSKQDIDKKQLEVLGEIAVLRGTGMLNKFTGLKHQENLTLSKQVFDALKLDWNDPAQAAAGQQMLAAVQARIQPELMNDLLTLHRAQNEVVKQMKAFFDENPEWSSGQRSGKYRVRFKNEKGELELQGADSKEEAMALVGKGKLIEFYEAAKKNEEIPDFGENEQALYERVKQWEEQQRDIFAKLGYGEDTLSLLEKTSAGNQLGRDAQALGVSLPGAPVRGLTRGAENLPWLSNHLSWLTRTSTYWSRRLFREQMDAYIAHKEIPDEMKADLRTHKGNILMADPESIQKLNAFTRVWFMGFNMANVIINAFQPFTTHVAELTNLTGKPLQSYKRVIAALKETAGHRWGKKEWSDPDVAWMVEKASQDGEVGLSMYDDNAIAQEAATLNLKDAMDGLKPKSFGQRLSKVGDNYSFWAMKAFTAGEQVNNHAALVSAFKLFREQGFTKEAAYDKAVEFNHKVNFGGGRAQRPVGMFSSRSPVLRGTAMLGASMQSYVLGTTFQLIRYLQRGLFRPNGLTPGERFAARAAGVQMIATQLAAAGLLGLPFVSGALSLLDKAFPELEANRKLREGVDSLTGNAVLNDMAMTGIPSMLGWDMQSRLSMGNTLPGVSEVNGFQPENLLGPPANLVTQLVFGGTRLLRGDAAGAKAFVPSGAKKLVELWGGEGKLKDYREREILDPTPGEKVGAILGFNPKRLSDFNAASRISELNDRVEGRREGEFRQQLAEVLLQGQFGNVQTALKARAMQEPGYDLANSVRGIAKAAEELSFPRDLRRSGGGSNRNRLLQLWNMDPNRVSEVDRLKFRKQIEAKFGLQDVSQSSLREAMLIDQIQAKDPSISRASARRQAQALVRRETSSVLLE